MFWAVAAGLPATWSAAGTYPIAKKPKTMLTTYRPPAIRASWRGDARAIQSVVALPRVAALALRRAA
jgi:hypothetical protein